MSLKLPVVQNWLAKELTAYLSAELKTKITVDQVEIKFFNKVSLKNFYFEDREQDTLMYADNLTAHFDISKILKGKLVVKEVDLYDAAFEYHRHKGEKTFNLQILIDYFKPKKTRSKKNKFELAINRIRFKKARFHLMDEIVGTEIIVRAPIGFLQSRKSNITGFYAEFDSLAADNADVKIRIFEQSPIDGFQFNSNDSLQFIRPNWNVTADKIRLSNLKFQLLNERIGIKPELPLDFSDLNLRNTDLLVENLQLKDFQIEAKILNLSSKEKRGFEINSFYGNILVNSEKTVIDNFELKTANSTIGNRLEFNYSKFSDYLEFVKKVRIDAFVTNSEIALSDIITFAPKLNNIPFFKTNKDKVVFLDCSFFGKVDSFQVQDVVLNSNNTHLEGHMSMKPFEKYLEFDIHQLETSNSDIISLLSFVKLPTPITRINQYNFMGRFEGYLDKEIVSSGKLITETGQAEFDIKIDPRGGFDNIKYDGFLELTDFEAGTVLNLKDFGKLSLYADISGKGLTIDGLDSEVRKGHIDYLEYKGYSYDTIDIDGKFTQKKFQGHILSQDNNFDFDLFGSVDLNHNKPVIDIKGKINEINFCELNLMINDLIIGIADVDLNIEGYKIDDFSGSANLRNINFHRGYGSYHIDFINLFSKDSIDKNNSDSIRVTRLVSDLADANISGKYDLINLPKALLAFAEEYYPNFTRNINLARADDSLDIASTKNSFNKKSFDSIPYQSVHVNVNIHDSKRLTEIINKDFSYIKGSEFKFDFDNKTDDFSIFADIDSVKWGDYKIIGEKLTGSGNKNYLKIVNSLSKIIVKDTSQLPAPYVEFTGRGDSIDFVLKVMEIGKIASNINLNGIFEFNRQSFVVKLKNSGLIVLNQIWNVQGDNFISFDFENKNLKVQNLVLQDSASLQKIELKSYKEKGLMLIINKFDLARLYEPVKLPMFNISGFLNANIYAADIFKQENLNAQLKLFDLKINGDEWKEINLTLNTRSLKDSIKGELVHQGKLLENLNADFYLIPAYATKDISRKNYLDLSFNIQNAKGRILEYFMGTIASNTQGIVNAKGRIYGKTNKLNIEGSGKIKNLAMTINFLNTRYSIDSTDISIRNDGFVFLPELEFNENTNAVKKGIPIKDQEGNIGYLGGRILHTNLKKWGIDLDLIMNRNLTLNTDSKSNMPFYGKVYATGRANLSGLFTKLTMNIEGTTNSGPNNQSSTFFLPVMKPVEVNQAIDYLVFKDMKRIDTIAVAKPKFTASGMEVNLKINATPDATARIIIDEKAGDVIEGKGNGNIQVKYTSTGELFLNGDYIIDQGNYLFTYRGLVNKPFTVQKGGTIRWSGDPYNADINLKAKYIEKSRLYNLLLSYQEELRNSETRDAANRLVDVEVIMNMTGSLMRPDIKFGLNIVGDVSGRVATLSNLAIRAIQQDESKLNRQVFGLIALNQFLPEQNATTNINVGASSFNTLSEMITQQFSRFLGDYLSDWARESNVISSVDVQIGYKLQEDQVTNTGTGSQFDLGLDNYLLKDKLRVHFGGNVDFNNNSSTGINQNYFGGDFIIEYALTQDGNLKVRVYSRGERSIFGDRLRYGGGLSYQLEFDSFDEIMSEIKEKVAKSKAKKMARRKEEEAGMIQ